MLSRIHVRTKTFLALRNLNWFHYYCGLLCVLKSALRVHYLPLCLLENHYGAIKSNVVSHTETWDFPSVSDGCALPLCLLWICTLVTVKRIQLCLKTLLAQMAVASLIFPPLLDALWHSRDRDFHKWWCATDSLEAMWVWNVQWQNSSSPQNEEIEMSLRNEMCNL